MQFTGQTWNQLDLDSFMPTGSTSRFNFRISRRPKILWEASPAASHVNYAVCEWWKKKVALTDEKGKDKAGFFTPFDNRC